MMNTQIKEILEKCNECYSKGEVSRKACQSLGQGEERVYL